MDQETQPSTTAQFEGWAVVEVMGHRRLAGYVTTKAFGAVVMFEIVAPEVLETEEVLTEDRYLTGRLCGKGTRIATGRPRLAPMVGAGSIYQLTPCSEEEALSANPLRTRIVEFVAPESRKQLTASSSTEADYDDEEEDSDDDLKPMEF